MTLEREVSVEPRVPAGSASMASMVSADGEVVVEAAARFQLVRTGDRQHVRLVAVAGEEVDRLELLHRRGDGDPDPDEVADLLPGVGVSVVSDGAADGPRSRSMDRKMSIASTSSLDWVSGGRAAPRTSPAVNPLALAMLWASGQRARIDSEAPIWPSRNSDVPRGVSDAAECRG